MSHSKVSIYNFKPIRHLMRWARKIILPGVNGASLHDVGRFFILELNEVRLSERAAGVTYNFIMAMPPTLLFLFSLVPYLPLKNVEQTILSTLKLLTPNNKIYQTTSGIVSDFLTKQHHDVLSFGLIMVLFFASNGMMGLMNSFDASMSLYKKRSWFRKRWTAMKLTLMLIVVSILTLGVLIIQNKTLNGLILAVFHFPLAVKILSFTILILVIFVTICFIYTYGPSLTHKFNFVSAGSVFATLSSVIATSVFFFLVNNFLNYNKVYGSIGTLIAFMVLVWLNTLIILLGYELNVSLLLGKLSKEKRHEHNE